MPIVQTFQLRVPKPAAIAGEALQAIAYVEVREFEVGLAHAAMGQPVLAQLTRISLTWRKNCCMRATILARHGGMLNT